MTMRQGLESQALNWAHFARTPGLDSAHEDINLPALLDLLPPPGHRTLDLACGEGRLFPLAGIARPPGGGDRRLPDDGPARRHPPVAGARAARATPPALPFRDGTFDLVVAYMSLQLIDDMPQAVAEIARASSTVRAGRASSATAPP